jgi:SAM-dependent methyltransferase
MPPPAVTSAPQLPELFRACADIFECPVGKDPLFITADGLVSEGGRHYAITDGIPNLFVTEGSGTEQYVTDAVKAFYEETPFPSYDEFDSRESLFTKARRSVFAAMLDEQLPNGAVILEAGCGTGQLTNFLGLAWNRRVFGCDICRNSLKLGKEFRDRFLIANSAFLQADLFRPPLRDNSLDVVISNGVLHHTFDPRRGFNALLRKVKPGGIIIIGLYNRFGRLPTLWRRWIFNRLGPASYFLDRRLSAEVLNESRLRAWFRDQYAHPHETRHSISEVLSWFDSSGVEFLSSVPPADGSAFRISNRLFEAQPRGTLSQHWSTEAALLPEGGQDGGLFVMIGRKR